MSSGVLEEREAIPNELVRRASVKVDEEDAVVVEADDEAVLIIGVVLLAEEAELFPLLPLFSGDELLEKLGMGRESTIFSFHWWTSGYMIEQLSRWKSEREDTRVMVEVVRRRGDVRCLLFEGWSSQA
jgi:hypothetical protein